MLCQLTSAASVCFLGHFHICTGNVCVCVHKRRARLASWYITIDCSVRGVAVLTRHSVRTYIHPRHRHTHTPTHWAHGGPLLHGGVVAVWGVGSTATPWNFWSVAGGPCLLFTKKRRRGRNWAHLNTIPALLCGEQCFVMPCWLYWWPVIYGGPVVMVVATS